MKSLTELNSVAGAAFEITDDRPAAVIFDRFVIQDSIITVSSTTVNATPSIEIEEVINYSTADVRYIATINSPSSTFLSGSSLNFGTLPSGVVSTTSTTSTTKTYTLTGINSDAIWQQIRQPVWTIPAGYATFSQWYLSFQIVYYDQATDSELTKDWLIYDPNYYYLAQLQSSASQSISYTKVADTLIAMTPSFDLETDGPFKTFRGAFNSLFTVASDVFRFKGITKNLSAQFSSSNDLRRIRGITKNLPTTAVISALAGKLKYFASQMTVVAGPIGPGGVAYLEGNGFSYASGLGSWPQGFPGIVRIRDGSVTISSQSSLSCVGADARLVSAMVMSTGTLFVDADHFIGTVQQLPSEFSASATPRFDASAFANINSQLSVDSIIGVIKPFLVDISSTANVSLVITGDNPVIPTLDFEPTEVTVSQTLVNTTNLLGQQNQLALLGKRSDGWHRLWMYPTGNGAVKYAHNDTQAASSYQLSIDTGSANQLYSTSDAYFNTDGSYSGVAFHYSSGTYVIAHLTYVDSWSSSPTQTSTPQRAASNNRSDEYVKSGATNRIVGTALTPLYDTTTQRGLGFFTNGTSTFSIKCTKHIWNNTEFTHNSISSFTVTSLYSPTLPWNTVGFTSDSSTVRFLVLRYTSLTAIDLLIGTTVINDENAPSVSSTGTVFSVNNNPIATNDLATVWDDFDNDKFVALAMAVDDTGIDLRAVKITDWSTSAHILGAAKTVSGYGAGVYLPSAKLTRIKGTQGMAVLTYQRSSGDDAVLGRLISINSSTLQVDISAETYFGSSNDVTSVRMDSYLVDFAKSGTEYAFALAWKEINGTPNTRGGTTFSTATG